MCEVELEFAADMRTDGRLSLRLLQVRPVGEYGHSDDLDIDKLEKSFSHIYITSSEALGNGLIDGLDRIVYVSPESFDTLKTTEIAAEIAKINASLRDEGKSYLLIGPGRWGSSVPTLGIPVIWSDISEARMIVECSIEGLRVEPSQGTHFFQNITSLGVGYVSVDTVANPSSLDTAGLEELSCVFKGKYVKVLECPEGFTAYIDRRSNRAVVGVKL